jgi:hypothetical protein
MELVEDDMHGWKFMSALETEANESKNEHVFDAVRAWRELMRK